MESPDFRPLFRVAKWFVVVALLSGVIALGGLVLAVVWLFQHVRFF